MPKLYFHHRETLSPGLAGSQPRPFPLPGTYAHDVLLFLNKSHPHSSWADLYGRAARTFLNLAQCQRDTARLAVDDALPLRETRAASYEALATQFLGVARELATGPGPGAVPAVLKPYRFALLACSKSKLSEPSPAQALYTGQLFRLARELAGLVADRLFILSAEHHLVAADRVVAPYDTTLARMCKEQKQVWGGIVANDLRTLLGAGRTAEPTADASDVLCLAPGSYVDAIGFLYGMGTWARPLRGLGIGQQKAALASLIRDAKASPAAVPALPRRAGPRGRVRSARSVPTPRP